MMSTKCDAWGYGTFMSDYDNKMQRLDMNNTETSVTLIYRFDKDMLYVVHPDEDECESWSLKGIKMPDPCLDKSSRKLKSVIFGVDTKADVWETILMAGMNFTSRIAFDQIPISKNYNGNFNLWKQVGKEEAISKDRVPISLCLYNKYEGVFFHQFTNFKKTDKLDGEMFEPPKSCKMPMGGGEVGDEGSIDDGFSRRHAMRELLSGTGFHSIHSAMILPNLYIRDDSI